MTESRQSWVLARRKAPELLRDIEHTTAEELAAAPICGGPLEGAR